MVLRTQIMAIALASWAAILSSSRRFIRPLPFGFHRPGSPQAELPDDIFAPFCLQ
ncbi:hypothetical protein Brsp02_02923 [Brucella sp. NBRC 113783]